MPLTMMGEHSAAKIWQPGHQENIEVTRSPIYLPEVVSIKEEPQDNLDLKEEDSAEHEAGETNEPVLVNRIKQRWHAFGLEPVVPLLNVEPTLVEGSEPLSVAAHEGGVYSQEPSCSNLHPAGPANVKREPADHNMTRHSEEDEARTDKLYFFLTILRLQKKNKGARAKLSTVDSESRVRRLRKRKVLIRSEGSDMGSRKRKESRKLQDEKASVQTESNGIEHSPPQKENISVEFCQLQNGNTLDKIEVLDRLGNRQLQNLKMSVTHKKNENARFKFTQLKIEKTVKLIQDKSYQLRIKTSPLQNEKTFINGKGSLMQANDKFDGLKHNKEQHKMLTRLKGEELRRFNQRTVRRKVPLSEAKHDDKIISPVRKKIKTELKHNHPSKIEAPPMGLKKVDKSREKKPLAQIQRDSVLPEGKVAKGKRELENEAKALMLQKKRESEKRRISNFTKEQRELVLQKKREASKKRYNLLSKEEKEIVLQKKREAEKRRYKLSKQKKTESNRKENEPKQIRHKVVSVIKKTHTKEENKTEKLPRKLDNTACRRRETRCKRRITCCKIRTCC